MTDHDTFKVGNRSLDWLAFTASFTKIDMDCAILPVELVYFVHFFEALSILRAILLDIEIIFQYRANCLNLCNIYFLKLLLKLFIGHLYSQIVETHLEMELQPFLKHLVIVNLFAETSG